MDSYGPLAQFAVTSRRHDLAFSALPDAPVLPWREPHRITVAWRAAVRALRSTQAVAIPRRTRRQCASTA